MEVEKAGEWGGYLCNAGKAATTTTIDINPFTAPACKISGLNDTSSAMRLDEKSFHRPARKGRQKALQFLISRIYVLFSK